MKSFTTKILENRQISPDFYLLAFEWDRSWGEPLGGNFLELKVNSSSAPLLRRPFAFSGYSDNRAEMIYQIRGESTKLLSNKQVGDTIDLIAPLGNSFTVTDGCKSIIAIAGGVGLGPILFAANEAKSRGLNVTFVTGFRSSELIPDRELFTSIDANFCTDDGSEGFKGNVVEFLSNQDSSMFDDSVIWACGPTPMLKAIHNFAKERGVEAQVSMEEMMACGIGACMGCVIETTDERGMARVCKDGPIFESGVV
jgi:dihydroorotate dehydrogenase electron transfer subunit